MKNLYISEVLLLSEKEKKAKKINLDEKRTLIFGKNDTGKSSLIKSIYRTFGAETTINSKFAKSNVISSVKFSLDDVTYQIIRDQKRFAIFKSDELIKICDSVTNELAPFFSELFNFKPLFQTKNNNFIVPPPAFLLLPFYIDQDESWSKSWNSFKNLMQIKDYRNQCINYHSGIKPNSYFETKSEIDSYTTIIEETDKEKKITLKILDNVKEKLSQTSFNIDIVQFENEITELLTELETLKIKEEECKENLHDLYHLKANYEVQINIINQAILESHKDYNYAVENLSNEIDCPTCGASYHNNFAERFEIAQDEQKSKDLLVEVKRELKDIILEIEKISNNLVLTSTEVEKINNILETKKGKIQLKDVIESAGKNQVNDIFKMRYDELQKIISENTSKKEGLEKKLKELESKKRKQEIVTFFTSTLTRYLRDLDIHSLTIDDYKSILTKIENLETGSSRPRALIAYYFTFFHLMNKYSSNVYFPLIIDSPNQQDQDIEHIDKIMKFIDENQPKNSQMILGLAETYGVDFKCPEINLKERYNLLQNDEYENVKNELSEKIHLMWE